MVQVMDFEALVGCLDAIFRIPCMMTLQPTHYVDYKETFAFSITTVHPEVRAKAEPYLQHHFRETVDGMFHVQFDNYLRVRQDSLLYGQSYHEQVRHCCG